MDDFYKKILDNNKKWVENHLKIDPNFFEGLSKGQNPPLLWIGCSDSRVPANEIIGAGPGEVFVHRNIANMVIHSDMNMLSVLDYAVNALKIKHIIVCGHYGCGGIKAAMGNESIGIIDNWIRHIKDTYRLHQKQLDAIVNLLKAAPNESAALINDIFAVVSSNVSICEVAPFMPSFSGRKIML